MEKNFDSAIRRFESSRPSQRFAPKSADLADHTVIGSKPERSGASSNAVTP